MQNPVLSEVKDQDELGPLDGFAPLPRAAAQWHGGEASSHAGRFAPKLLETLRVVVRVGASWHGLVAWLGALCLLWTERSNKQVKSEKKLKQNSRIQLLTHKRISTQRPRILSIGFKRLAGFQVQ